MKRILLSIAVLALSVSLQAEIKQQTYDKYSDLIGKTLTTDVSNVNKLRKPVETIIEKGSTDQRMWLSAALQRVNIRDVKEDVQWEYSYWIKALTIELSNDNPMLKPFVHERFGSQHFWRQFYKGRDLYDIYAQEVNLLSNVTDCMNLYIQLRQHPELDNAASDFMGFRSHYFDDCLNGNDSTAIANYGMRLSAESFDRLATLLGSRDFAADPTQFRPLFEQLSIERFDRIISFYSDIWLYSLTYLSTTDQNAVLGLINQFAQTLGRSQEVINTYIATLQTHAGTMLQWYQTNLDMLLLHNEMNQDFYASFFQFRQELIDQGKEFVQYAPSYCPPELQEDSLFLPYVKEYIRFGYAICQELDANGFVSYLQSNGEIIRNLLNNMGYDTTSENWEFLFAQFMSDLLSISIQFYETDQDNWLVGACLLEARLVAYLADIRGYYNLYYAMANATYFINRYLNDEVSVKFLMDNYLIPFVSGVNVQSFNREDNCLYIHVAATILPYARLYDDPYGKELGEAIVDKLNKGIWWNSNCENNGFAKMQLADFYLNEYATGKSDASLVKCEKYLDEFITMTGDTASYYLYKQMVAAYRKDYSTAAAYIDWLNRDDPEYVSTMMYNKSLYPAWIYAMDGQNSKAQAQLDLFRTFTDEYFGSQMLIIGDEQAANMLKRYAEVDDGFAGLCHDSIDAQIKQSAIGHFYDWMLLTKGVLLALNSETDAILSNHPSAKVRELHAQRKQQEAQLSAMTDKNSLEAERLQTAITNTQRNLTEVLQQYIDKHGFSGVNLIRWQQVQKALKRDEVAIEFGMGKVDDNDSLPTYFALMLRHGDNMPKAIELFNEHDLRQLTKGKNEKQVYNNLERNMEVAHLILDSLQGYLHEGQTVYYSPCGMLHQIAFENMQWTDESLVSELYDLHRLSSTRQLTLRKSHEDISVRDSIVLYGGIVYDAGQRELLAESRRYPDQQLALNRSAGKEDIDRGEASFLPGAQNEVLEISRMLSSTHQPYDLRMGVQANEESFKSLNLSHTALLHIATHGFFWENDAATQSQYFKAGVSEEQALQQIDPMRRCGLLMAGANIALSGHAADLPEGVQDGVLTAQEISLLDLSNTRLVILSACETGVGEVNGDGVFGLQRAFKKAGVQTLIMSLWKVSDAATQLLMTEFYRNWVNLHQPKRTAFRNAQNTVRMKFPEPTYWAGFIMLD